MIRSRGKTRQRKPQRKGKADGQETDRPKARLKKSRDLAMEDLKASRDSSRGDRENRKGQGVEGDTVDRLRKMQRMKRRCIDVPMASTHPLCVRQTQDRSHP